jgi:hypothetical protein
MTIFDVLKYPLSIPVTDKEFSAVPETIRHKYYTMRWGDSEWVAQQPNADRRILKKLLEEYNDDI